MNTGKNADLPLGLGMALMQNTDAFLIFQLSTKPSRQGLSSRASM